MALVTNRHLAGGYSTMRPTLLERLLCKSNVWYLNVLIEVILPGLEWREKKKNSKKENGIARPVSAASQRLANSTVDQFSSIAVLSMFLSLVRILQLKRESSIYQSVSSVLALYVPFKPGVDPVLFSSHF